MKKPLHSFGQRVPKCTPNFRLSPKKFFEKIYPFTCSHWEAPNYRVFMKNFYLLKSLSLIWNYKSQWHPISQKKWEIFFIRLRALYFACTEKAFSLIPTGSSQMHPLNFKKFIPSLIWNWEVKTHPVFTKNLKIFFVWLREAYFYLHKKSFHLFEIWVLKRTLFFRKKTKKFARRARRTFIQK